MMRRRTYGGIACVFVFVFVYGVDVMACGMVWVNRPSCACADFLKTCDFSVMGARGYV